MQLDFKSVFKSSFLRKEAVEIIMNSLELMNKDHLEACEMFKLWNEVDKDEFCHFNIEIELFASLIKALFEGEDSFISTLCDTAKEFDSNFK